MLNVHGATLFEVYFVKASPFDLTTLQTGFYQSARSVSEGTADLLVMGLLVVMGASDIWIMLIAVSVHSVCDILVGFADKLWQLYASKNGTVSDPSQHKYKGMEQKSSQDIELIFVQCPTSQH